MLNMEYIVVNDETGASGTRHYQGYVVWKRRLRLTSIVSIMGTNKICWLIRKAKHEAARDYCMKEETRTPGTTPFEKGTPPPGSGARTDLQDFMGHVRDGDSFWDLMNSHPEIIAKYPAFVSLYRNTCVTRSYYADYPGLPGGLKEEWQQKLCTMLEGPTVKRRIIWIWSRKSATGKTETMKYLESLWPGKVMAAGDSFKFADVMLAFQPENRVVWFNCPRGFEFHTTHRSVLEKFSDGGCLLSTKYVSVQKKVDVHVVITTNVPPTVVEEYLPDRIVELHAQLGDIKDEPRASGRAFSGSFDN